MQKYTNGEEVRYFELDVDISKYIDLNEYRLMTEAEILKHETPKPTQFYNIWDDVNKVWLDSRTPEQIAEYERSLLPPLTKRQFSLYLFDIGKYDQVMNALNTNPRFKIEFDTVSVVERNSPTVSAMGQILEWDDMMVDEKWKEALKL